ncbi:septum site-determining protein MinC [Niallia endozanthoxylica]|uniref:Probable septum site-determining protein MinC n=1 Tax=Niallia endozanthoxylica TaxID=2036016 RepID=A0A5J5HSR3_9BACI|nr:septum site-determining protein MinC [Niallia endozanthoxylica]KAA9023125.1 septum site-determining protein MinC [Niallia endozanthoxylica]
MKKLQNVTIRGTKEGLTLHLNDSCSFEELKKELQWKLSETSRLHDGDQLITVKVQVGNRYLTEQHAEELEELINKKKNFIVDSITSNVMTKEEIEKMKQEQEIVSVTGIVRSGQVLKVPGDLLLIGDVNPGGTVMAGGNIFIMGVLKGIAHAGCFGNSEAIIAASVMKPSQLRISKHINRAPDHYDEEESKEMECAFINEDNQMMIDKLQVLMHIRPNLTRLERGR